MNKKSLLIIAVIIFVIYEISTLTFSSFKNNMNTEVRYYLITERNYREDDILKIYTQIGKLPLVSTTVIFKDEPNARYFYRKENGLIYQFSSAPVNGVDHNFNFRYKHSHDPMY